MADGIYVFSRLSIHNGQMVQAALLGDSSGDRSLCICNISFKNSARFQTVVIDDVETNTPSPVGLPVNQLLANRPFLTGSRLFRQR